MRLLMMIRVCDHHKIWMQDPKLTLHMMRSCWYHPSVLIMSVFWLQHATVKMHVMIEYCNICMNLVDGSNGSLPEHDTAEWWWRFCNARAIKYCSTGWDGVVIMTFSEVTYGQSMIMVGKIDWVSMLSWMETDEYLVAGSFSDASVFFSRPRFHGHPWVHR